MGYFSETFFINVILSNVYNARLDESLYKATISKLMLKDKYMA